MKISNENTDAVVLDEIGRRAARIRLDRNLTQSGLADEAGVHRNTIDRFESGQSISLTNFIRVLRALGLLAEFDQLIAEPVQSPIDQLKLSGKSRKRARAPRGQTSDGQSDGGWSWGDREPNS